MNELLRRLLFLPPQASSMAKRIDLLHYSIILVTLAGAALVAALAIGFAVRYRRRGATDVAPEAAPTNRKSARVPYWFELGVIAGLLTLFLGWWVVGFRQYVELETPPPDALNIHVIAKQWMWTFVYPSGTASKAVLYVPVARPVKLIFASRDVIHSFYVPAFRVKQDAVPRQSTALWFQAEQLGTYPVLCAEYCGTDHSRMRAEVVVLSAAALARRLEGLAPLRLSPSRSSESALEASSLASAGERIAAEHGCLRCHTLDGTPHIGPTWARLYESDVPIEGGARVKADEAYLTESMMDPRVKVRQGFPAVMPTYQGSLDVAEVGALIELIRALRDAGPVGGAAPLAPAGPPTPELPREGVSRAGQPERRGP